MLTSCLSYYSSPALRWQMCIECSRSLLATMYLPALETSHKCVIFWGMQYIHTFIPMQMQWASVMACFGSLLFPGNLIYSNANAMSKRYVVLWFTAFPGKLDLFQCKCNEQALRRALVHCFSWETWYHGKIGRIWDRSFEFFTQKIFLFFFLLQSKNKQISWLKQYKDFCRELFLTSFSLIWYQK